MLFRRILVPVDLSDRSLPSLRLAIAIAREVPDARVAIVHVAKPQAPAVIAELQRLVSAVDRGDVRVDTLAREGDPAANILALATEGRFDAIVIGTRPRMGVADYLLGSVAMRVIAEAPCPVITIRPDLNETKRTPQSSREGNEHAVSSRTDRG